MSGAYARRVARIRRLFTAAKGIVPRSGGWIEIFETAVRAGYTRAVGRRCVQARRKMFTVLMSFGFYIGIDVGVPFCRPWIILVARDGSDGGSGAVECIDVLEGSMRWGESIYYTLGLNSPVF